MKYSEGLVDSGFLLNLSTRRCFMDVSNIIGWRRRVAPKTGPVSVDMLSWFGQ